MHRTSRHPLLNSLSLICLFLFSLAFVQPASAQVLKIAVDSYGSAQSSIYAASAGDRPVEISRERAKQNLNASEELINEALPVFPVAIGADNLKLSTETAVSELIHDALLSKEDSKLLPDLKNKTSASATGASPVVAQTQLTSACAHIIIANVVAIDQVYFYNRFGAFNPAGMMYALSSDVEDNGAGEFHLKANKRPRPIVLRVNEGDCLQVNFTNRLSERPPDDSTATRNASMHVNGMDYIGDIGSDGANVGQNDSSLVAPGKTKTYTWYAAKQGQYLLYSMGAPAGGEGDGGQLVLGLFGSVNVEPRSSKWYRSQVTAHQLQLASHHTPDGKLVIDYEAVDPDTHLPVLNMLNGNEIIYTDLNAIITDPSGTLHEDCTDAPQSSTCGQPFREFTVIFHDEIKAVQAFPEVLDQDLFHGVRDGFAINYGSTSLGAEVIANRLKVGPAANCNECKFEEFFLESWVNGDPALIVKKDDSGRAVEALFPDDPSNVHHSYLNDPVRFRNLHAGPKETHVFHLHAHQWLQSPREDGSTYLDSQTISPGAAFTYEINYGGSGNRNINPGDAIFHCHLYPHFAQGMWELWRNHDVFEDGSPERNLPDAEIAGGTPNPAIIPIPNKPLPLMPTPDFKGYPFYIAAEAGHRPPQPPYDSEWDGGLQRHIILKSTVVDGYEAIKESNPALIEDPVFQKVFERNDDPNPFPPDNPLSQEKIVVAFARTLTSAKARFLDPLGEDSERIAIEFHEGIGRPGGVPVVTQYGWRAIGYPSSLPDGTSNSSTLFLVNGLPPKPGAPYADPCPTSAPVRPYRAAYIQFDMTINAYKWHDRQARIAILEQDALATGENPPNPEPLFFRANSGECITFAATNLIPNNLNLDDFQIFTPTDIIGQHIHLVKFDVTSSDGAGNGWNYEDGTFSPDEVRERVRAIRAANGCPPISPADEEEAISTDLLRICPKAKPHPVFGTGPHGEFIGAQTTIQRWWADPLINNYDGKDRTIRTVFTHDHFGPSSHQHHGLYAALVVEPPNSDWTSLDGTVKFGTRDDGGPTSFAANIIPPPNQKPPYREFNLAFGDFAIVYTDDLQPVNPPRRMEADLPIAIEPPPVPRPEAISAADPGTQVVNYRNEPIPLRIGQNTSNGFTQKPGDAGDLARVFNSNVHLDPFTPLLQANEGDRVQVRLIQGAQEEQHVFNIHGQKWLFEPSAPNSGFRNGQQIGISEHFEFEIGPQPERLNRLGRRFTDYLYSSAATDNLWDGQWGILRIYQGRQPIYAAQPAGAAMATPTNDLAPLPNNPDGRIAKSEFFNEVCPASTQPPRTYTVFAVLARDLLPQGKLIYNDRFRRIIEDPNAIMFVNKEDYDGLQNGSINPEPLILRANAGDCIKVTLYNQLPQELPENDSWNEVPMIVNHFNFNQIKTSNRVGLHPQLVAVDTRTQDGADVGFNQDSTVGPGESITYTWYAGNKVLGPDGLPTPSPVEFGAIGLRDMGDVIKHSSHGAIGSLVIEPQGSHWDIDQSTGTNRAVANVYNQSNSLLFREFVVLYQDDLSLRLRTPIWCQFCDRSRQSVPLKNISDTDDSEDTGMKAFNYRTEPFWLRMGWDIDTPEEEQNMADFSNVLSSRDPNPGCSSCGDPATPLFTAVAGQPVRFRVLDVAGHPRQHGFTVFGHHWNFEPWVANSTVQGTNPFTFEIGSASGIGPTRHENILTTAGGLFNIPGDYLYRTQDSYNFSGGGLWGLFRVYPAEILIDPPPPVEGGGVEQSPPQTSPKQ